MDFRTENLDSIIEHYNTDVNQGLTQQEVENKRKEFGENQFDEQQKQSLFSKVLDELKDVTTIILIIAAVISTYIAVTDPEHSFSEPIVIFSIILLNIIIAIRQEGKAEDALASLKNMSSPMARVLREGREIEIDAVDIVPGDILLLEAGEKIAADARLISSSNLQVEESALTGESAPVDKDEDAEVKKDAAIGDTFNTVFSGTSITNGRGKAVVVATGMNTEMGSVADLLSHTGNDKTPLQERMDRLGKQLALLALIAGAIIFTLSALEGEEFITNLLTAVSLAVAAVPETLPVIVTITLAYGVQNMVGRNAIIRNIPAVETLGSASVIASDKTGTLTQNKMTIQRIWALPHEPVDATEPFNEEEEWMLKMMGLASNASLEEKDGHLVATGNPTEGAILLLLHDKGISKEQLANDYPRVHEIPFNSDRKLMTTVHQLQDGYISITKGAFDRIPVDLSVVQDEDGHKAGDIHDSFAHDALRVLAVGYKHYDTLPDSMTAEELEKDVTFAGIVGMIDPPREESAQSVKEARSAGIRPIMITGDHAATATAIARQIGIYEEGDKSITGAELSKLSSDDLSEHIREYSVYARVSPEDKIRIVEAWQKHGEVVAMTGDGVNDAPALKAADVGTAMGQGGTEVAKNASDMILTDDNFATIVHAVEEGRRVYDNIRKTAYFLLSCNVAEILVMLLGSILGLGLPLVSIQLLFINVVADGIPGFGLSQEKADDDIMERVPIERNASIFANGGYRNITIAALTFTVTTLAAFYIGSSVELGAVTPSEAAGQTMAFLTLGWASVIHIFNARTNKSIFKTGLLSNKSVFWSAMLSVALVTVVATLPFLQDVFYLVPLEFVHWIIAFLLSLMIIVVVEIQKLIFRKRNKRFF